MTRWSVLVVLAIVTALGAHSVLGQEGGMVHGHLENGAEVIHNHTNDGSHDHVNRGQKTLITDIQPKGEVVGHRIIHPENPDLCPLGCKGDDGIKGAPGPRGREGQRGVAGEAGEPGYGGWAGFPATEYAAARARAVKGDVGAPGNAGDPGMDGTDGEDGVAGHQGPAGNPGPRGEAGGNGVPGMPGNSGRSGAPGPQGLRGESGIDGIPGAQGAGGAAGDTGAAGIDGVDGSRGIPGIPGNPGDIGAKGVRGSRGAIGNRGVKGFEGDQGIVGADGSQGLTGEQGSTGMKGVEGLIGFTGFNGDIGEAGEQGEQGEYGPYIEKTRIEDARPCSSANAGKTLYDPETKKLFFCSDGAWQCVKNEVCNQDCLVSAWDDWGACSATCGAGMRRRLRKVTVTAGPLGAACPALHQDETCNVMSCFCEDPGSLQNGFRGATSGNAIGGAIEWICIPGYLLVGPKISVCRLDAGDSMPTFSEMPSCRQRACPRLSSIEFGTVSPHRTPYPHDTVTFGCRNGYELVGDAELTCTFDGTWDKPTPKCVPIVCQDPGAPVNGGRSASSYLINSVVQYTCNQGYRMTGQSSATCLSGGAYSSSRPTCELVNCGTPARPKSGRSFASTTSFGSIARFSCNMGYTLMGAQSALCQANGMWSEQPPTCRLVDCGDPGRTRNSIRTVSSTTFGSHANYQCQFGYILNGNEERICMASGDWSGAVPSCIAISCGDPGTVVNIEGVAGVGGYTYPEGRITFGPCKPGFTLRGERVLSCLASGQWNGPLPTCEPVDCGDVAAPLNGDRHRVTTDLGSEVTYKCHTGFTLVGEQHRICMSTGQWTGQMPRCIVVDCGDPGAPTNGRVSSFNTPAGRSPYSYEATVTFSCDDGYELRGAATRRCTDCGEWDQSMPLCVPMLCPNLNAVNNGDTDMANSTTFSQVSFQCDPGYTLMGERNVRCGTDSHWTTSPPLCEPNLCPSLPPPVNGAIIVAGNTFGDVAEITCDPGYKLQGSQTRMCQSDSQWSGEPAVCSLVDCGTPPAIADGRVSGNVYTYGAEVEYSCNTGYSRMGSDVRKCTASGSWSGQAPVCALVVCPNPGTISNGLRTPDGVSFSYGATVRYSCSVGFALRGAEVRNCDGDGTWSAPAPQCIALVCADPGVPSSGSRQLRTLQIGAQVDYACNSGYTLTGSPSATCEATSIEGVWSKPRPTCEIVDCGQPNVPENGLTSPVLSTTFGSDVRYHCVRGYLMVGQNSRTCLASGQWSGFAPQCAEIDCGDPGTPSNGARTGAEFTYGKVVSYTCDPGYELSGETRQECLSNSQWSSQQPICIGLTCANPGQPANGMRVGDDFSYGATIRYRCNSGFRLVGGAERTCDTSGVFSGSSPSCVPLACTDPGVPQDGDRLMSSLLMGSSVNFTCNTGFSLVGARTASCVAGASGMAWSSPLPVCRAVTCGDPEFGQTAWDGTRTSYSLWRDFSCQSGFMLTGTSSRRCTEDGTFSGVGSQCMPVDCGPLTAPLGGGIEITSTTFGSTATFTCGVGYRLVGGATRECTSAGTWSAQEPHCIRIRCMTPAVPAYGTRSTTVEDNDFLPGTMVNYQCNPGFFMSGSNQLECGLDGQWSDSAPTCVAHMCPVPVALTNGDTQMSSRLSGARVTYTCNVGYMLQGTLARRCVVNSQNTAATWTGQQPSCVAISCDSPPAIENGAFAALTNDNGYSYSCNTGYSLVGTSVRFCLIDGSLSGESPACQVVDCGAPPSLADGNVEVSTTLYGSTSRFGCNTGYELSGSSVRTCQADGFWSGSTAFCNIVDCGNPGAPAHGIGIRTTYTFGSTVSFLCDAGYQLVGEETVRCQANGLWSNSVPTCSVLDCGDPGMPANGGRSFSASSVASTVQYYCNVGYQLIGQETRECIANSGSTVAAWSGSMPTCRIVDCGEPETPTRGSRTGNVFTYNADVTFQCEAGYQIFGSMTRRCQASGLWSGTQPSCIVVDCQNPDSVLSGTTRFTTTIYNSVVTYSCQSGYSLVGDQTRTCQASAEWSGAPPQCLVVACDNPGIPAYGSREGDTFSFGSVVRYSCDSGYRLDGAATSRCTASQSWSSQKPTCVRLDCGDPGTPANGDRALSSTVVGSTVNYTCNVGYVRRGSQRRSCEATRDGRSAAWSASLPVCDIVDCGRQSAPTFGQMSGNVFTYGASVSFSCNPGYVLSGSEYRICQASGAFSGTAASCTVVDCGDPGTPSNGGRAGDSTVYNSVLTFTCNTGYRMHGSFNRECRASGAWSGSQPTCQIVDCDDPGTPNNGGRGGSLTTYLSTYTFTCNNGYRMAGSAARQCQASGEWSGTATSCIAIICSDPGIPINGGRDGDSFTLNSEVKYFCNPGFRLVGAASRTCQASGSFDLATPTCEVISCGDPGTPQNGAKQGEVYTYNSEVTFTCNVGYTLINSRQRVCEASGDWSGVQAACVPIDCGQPRAPTNGRVVVTDTFYQDEASYTCDVGYVLVGSALRVCRADSLWSESMPECHIIECCALESPANGVVTVSTLTYQSVASFTCNTNYFLAGSEERTCQANGEWSGTATQCTPLLCTDPGTPRNGAKTSFNLAIGGQIEYECQSGYRMVGQQTITCQRDQTWSHPVPTCQIINCGDPGVILNGQKTPSTFNYGETVMYQCNPLFTRNGPEAITCQVSGQWTPPPPTCDADCIVSQWGEWQQCSRTCGPGQNIRTRVILRTPEGIGRSCPHLEENRDCNVRPCVSCDGLLEGQIAYQIRPQEVDVATDVIIVVDESASMATEHAWLPGMIANLEGALIDQKIGNSDRLRNMYALVGYGQHASKPDKLYPHAYANDAGAIVFPAGDFSRVAQQLYSDADGETEDGYLAITYALQNLPLRRSDNVQYNVILITDEDRDVLPGGENVTRQTVKRLMRGSSALLNVVVDQQFSCGGRQAMGADFNKQAYLNDSVGGYTVCAGAKFAENYGTTRRDFTTLSHELNGAAWDIDLLRVGGPTALSFTGAFTAVKTAEVLRQIDLCRDCTCIDDGGSGSFRCRAASLQERCKCKAVNRDNEYVNGQCITVA